MLKIIPKDFFVETGMTEEMNEAMDRAEVSEEEYTGYQDLLKKDPEKFAGIVRKKPGYRQIFLYLYIRLAVEAKEAYQEAGITDKIYYDTMQDIIIWIENCQKMYGETGIEEGEWLWRHVTLKLFRIGRLQYELIEPQQDTVLNKKMVKAGGRYLNLHIPQGEPLKPEDCRQSLRMAASLFQPFRSITCHSWLLNPILKQILPEGSNILRYQSLFDIYALDPFSRQAEERVFGILLEDKSLYQETTGLQRALKQYLLQNGSFGGAYGEVKKEYSS